MTSTPQLATIIETSQKLACRLPVVHCFEFRAVRFAWFVRTGDLVRLSPAAFGLLKRVEAGESLDTIEGDVVNGSTELRAALGDLRALEREGFLAPEIELTSGELGDEFKSLLRHKPRNLMFFVTEACNLACAYCYEKNQGVHDRPLSLKQVDARRTIDGYLDETGGRAATITFFGGEPLLNFPVIRDTVHYAEQKARERGTAVDFTMTTNLTLLTEEIADFLAEHKFHVMVSLDGDQEANDRYRVFRDGSGTYGTVVDNLKLLIGKLRSAGVRLPRIRATMTAENIDPIRVEEHLRSLGTPLVEVGSTSGSAARGKQLYDLGGESVSKYRAHEIVEAAIDRALAALDAGAGPVPELPALVVKNLRRVHEDVTRDHVNAAPRPKLCGVCRNMKAVTPGGDLYPCHRYVGMEAFKFGNVHAGGMDAELVHGYYEALYRNYAENCTSCWARHLCGGQCPWYLSREDGTIAPPDEESCDGIRRGFETTLGLYATLLDRHPEAFRRIFSVDPDAVRGTAIGQAPDDSCQS